MDEFIVQLLAKIDTSQVINDINELKRQLEGQTINLKAAFDINSQKELREFAKKLQSALNQSSNGKINIDTSQILVSLNQVTKNAQQTGQQIGQQLNQGVTQGLRNNSNVLKELEKSYQNIKNLQVKKSTLDPVVDSSKLAKLNEEIAKVKNNYNSAFRSANKSGNLDISEWKEVKAAIDSATKSRIEYNNAAKVDYLNGQKDNLSRTLSNFKASLQESGLYSDELKQKITALESELANISNKGDLSTFKANLKSVQSEISTLTQATKIRSSIDTGSYQTKIAELEASFKKLGLSQDEVAQKMSSVKAAYQSLTAGGIGQEELIKREQTFNSELATTSNHLKILKAEMSEFVSTSKQVNLTNKIEKWLANNTRATKEARSELQMYLKELNSGQVTNARYAEISNSLTSINTKMQSIGRLGKSWIQTLSEGSKVFSYWISSTFLVMKAIQLIKNGLSSVKELDTALVDLKKTTTMTGSELEDFYYESNNVAKQMGVTTAEIINQASAFSRLGWSSAEAATKMAKLSSQFASISPGMSVDEATTNLTSIIKAYDIDVDDILDGVLSKINQVGNTFGTSNAEIAEGLKLSSAAMASLGGTFEENIALFTAGQEILQDASQMGNAIRSITMRIKGYDEETQEFSNDVVEATGKVADLTKVASNNNMGISMFTDASQTHYKSLVEYLGEISDIWDEIDEKSQVDLLQNLFGKNRAQAGAAIINNFDTVRKSLEEMENSAGSADREMSVIMDKQNCPYVQKCA